MEREANLVALGGLLHDIGKFKWRARHKHEKRHQDVGYSFLKKYFVERKTEYKELPLFAKYHHKSDLKEFNGNVRLKNLLNIVCEADNISSGERGDYEDKSFKIENPLECVLSSVYIGKGKAEKTCYPLGIFHNYFSPKKYHKNTRDDYENLFNNFEKEFEGVVKELNFNILMNLLEKYTTFIPAMMVESDISLFDHLKTTSAIALCLYHFHYNELDKNIEKKIEDRQEKKYIVVAGDISGIQDFIYTITSKGALKYLRARSLFLEVLVEDVMAEILDRFGLTRANIIFAGGGRFYILAYNTERAKDEIKKIAEKVNEWLFKEFWGKLYLAVDLVEVSGKELSKFKIEKSKEEEVSIWDVLNKKLKERKLRKFLDVAGEGDLIENYIPDSDNFGECDVCKAPGVLEEIEEDRVCEVCKSFLEVGKALPRSLGFVRITDTDKNFKVKYDLPFSKFVLIQKFEEISEFPEGSKVYVRAKEFEKVRKVEKYDFIPVNIGGYFAKDENGSVKEFDELAEEATGAKKLAVLRMDVDDLGKIFSCGLEDSTISRVATLSRFMNHFFKNCIDLICNGKVSADAPRIKNGRERKEVVVVYAGGDDLFIVGAWDHVFELAFEIEDAFRKYVGANPNITISAGYGIFDPKFPLYRMAEVTRVREETAKEEGEEIDVKTCGMPEKIKSKNRIYLLDRGVFGRENGGKEKNEIKFRKSYEWTEFRRIWGKCISPIYDANKTELLISRVLIRKILDARSQYLKNPTGFKWSILLVYYLSRAKLSRNGKRVIEIIPDIAYRDPEKVKREPQDIYFVDVPLKLVDFAVRGGG